MYTYSYLVQKYKMNLYNQLQMITFLLVTLPMRIIHSLICFLPVIIQKEQSA